MDRSDYLYDSPKFDSRLKRLLLLISLCSCLNLIAQQEARYYYTGSDGTRLYLPLGKISFADTVIAYELGTPRPVRKFRDPEQALFKPNYTSYQSPEFVSIGCEGRLTLGYTDNGFMNLQGPDLVVLEVGPARERTTIEISENGQDWIYAGTASGASSKLEFSDQGIDSTKVFHYVRLTDKQDQCNGITAGADIDAVAAINSVVELSINADVLFDVDKWELKPAANIILGDFVEAIKVVDHGTILIEGHTDSDGEDEYNMNLSRNRCTSVAQRLNSLITHSDKFEFELKAFGESQPRANNDTDENKQLNRRVEIMLLPPRSYYESLKK